MKIVNPTVYTIDLLLRAATELRDWSTAEQAHAPDPESACEDHLQRDYCARLDLVYDVADGLELAAQGLAQPHPWLGSRRDHEAAARGAARALLRAIPVELYWEDQDLHHAGRLLAWAHQ